MGPAYLSSALSNTRIKAEAELVKLDEKIQRNIPSAKLLWGKLFTKLHGIF